MKLTLLSALHSLQTWPWRETWQTLRQRFRDDRLGLAASSLTFTTLISLVPLVTVTLALFTAFPIFGKFQRALQTYFLQSLVPDSIAQPVLRALTQFASKASQLGAVGVVFLGITAVTLMLTIDRTLNAIWRVRKPRPIAQRVLVYWAAITLGPLLLGISLSLTSYALSASKGWVVWPGGVRWVLGWLEFGVLTAALASLFRYVPNTDVRWRHALGGAAFAALGWALAKKGLGWYLLNVPTYTNIYGAFATVPILLIWVYLAWVMVLLGAVVAAYAPSLRHHALRRWPVPGHRFALAVEVLRDLFNARLQASYGLGLNTLSEHLHTDALPIQTTLEMLQALDWVARLDESASPRYVLLCDPATTLAQPLIEKTLLDPTLELDSFWRYTGLREVVLQDILVPSRYIEATVPAAKETLDESF